VNLAVTLSRRLTETKMEESEQIVSVKHWVLIIILSSIPILNFILFIYWAAFPPLDINRNKQNYAVAILIVMVLFYTVAFSAWILGKF
jgi:glucan phosphoethanolaminetransferase (alkaline phosphatase superfamily)